MTGYLVGCDIGTGGTKAVVIDLRGSVKGTHYIEYPLITPRPGWAEHHPDTYWDAVVKTIKLSLEKAKINPSQVLGVGLSAMSPACILVDKDLNPLQNSHIWMDRRGTAESMQIKAQIGDDEVFRVSGNPIDPYYATVKLLWEKNNRPELYNKAHKMLTAKDYPLMKLTGQPVTDYGNASLIGVAFDIVKKEWNRPMLQELGLDVDKFPEVFPCDEVVGYVTREAAALTGLVEGTPVVAGAIDCNAAWVSTGIIRPGDNSITLGTAGVWGVVHEEPSFSRGMISVVHAADSRNKYTTVGALVCAGALIRYFRDTFAQVEMHAAQTLQISPYEIMNLEAEKVPAGSDGLLVLPYFMGERTPIWDPLARGVTFGMSLAHGRGHYIRSYMEGVAYGIKQNMKMVSEAGIPINPVVGMVEGGANSRLWRQIMADVLGVKTAYMKNSLGAPVGDAIVAGVGVGAFPNYEIVNDWVEMSEYHTPDPKNEKVYTGMYELYTSLYPRLKEDFVKLAEITGYK
ncbi:FGGY-family carbohydrate kinase [Brevibacillus centrosporus]|uniref:FGGY-family carbohydrate kinase n=1 Tax=Brevibacillus centrosporus TaxID=54910 RepID=UPI002E232884|nr:FGGY-family carbohydrate kinase [Brevibacillus centrosporus]